MINKSTNSFFKHLGFMAIYIICTAPVMADGDGTHSHDHQHTGQMETAGHAETHKHDEWVTPPAEYTGKRSNRWADIDAIARGKKIYEQVCTVCHGEDGRGTGPMAASLSHPPADLTNHFHHAPHDGDAYLFWRVSEGGLVEPFKSMGSGMLAFKDVLDEGERWDVLAYVHAYFHLGLARWREDADNTDKPVDDAHEHDHSGHEE